MSADDSIRITRFSTDAFAPADRHEAWANRDWPAIGPIFDTAPIGPFHNRSDRFALGPITVHVAEMASQRYERQAGRARRDGVDGLMVEILLAGTTKADAADTDNLNVAGGMAFNDLAQAHRHISSDTRTLLMSIPRNAAERNGINVRALHGRRVSPASTGLLRSSLLAAHKSLPDLTTAHGDRLGQIVLDLIGIALDVAGVRAPAAGRAARDTATLLAARRLIDDHLASPMLSADWLCSRLAVPRSRLYRVFQGDGGVHAFIRDRRLDRVAAALALTGNADRLVDLAERWGFSDAAHLNRAFRARFGVTPGDYRGLNRDR